MPKLGMEPIRRSALIEAAIREIGDAGSLDVTVGQIARRAGVSSALAHHYFGSKEQIFLAAMRRILSDFSGNVRARIAAEETPLARLTAVIEASFTEEQCEPEVVAAWLAFYVQAQTSADAARLLRIYARRLQSNLLHDLKKLTGPAEAERIAQALASLIDGFYIRNALQDVAPDREDTKAIVRDYLDMALGAAG